VHSYTSRTECRSKAARCGGRQREPQSRGRARVGDTHLRPGFVCVALAAPANLRRGTVVTLRLLAAAGV